MHCAYQSVVKSGKFNTTGYCYGLVDFTILKDRHDELVTEMKRRGYKHDDTKIIENLTTYINDSINAEHNINELKIRCKNCRERIMESFINK